MSAARGLRIGLMLDTRPTPGADFTSRRLTVLPAVLGLPYRHPGVVAKMAESLDRLSRRQRHRDRVKYRGG
jgi:hypothetical protein